VRLFALWGATINSETPVIGSDSYDGLGLRLIAKSRGHGRCGAVF
jgi:hypothetical protein